MFTPIEGMKFVLDTFTSSLRLDKLEDEEFEVVKKDATEHSRHLSARFGKPIE